MTIALCAIPSQAKNLPDINDIAARTGLAPMTGGVELIHVETPVTADPNAGSCPHPGVVPGSSYFHQLRNDYEKGTLPSEAELTGWFSGRCFYGRSPNTARNGILIGAERAITNGDNGNDGPLFHPAAPKTDFRIAQSSIDRSGPDFFDAISPDVESDIADALYPILDAPDSAVQETNGILGPQTPIRKFEGYYISTMKKPGADDMTCYFFKKVRN
jgi:hypothetical protein